MSNLGPQFDRAQRRHDNLMPEPDPPEPDGAVPCVCGFDYPWFEVANSGSPDAEIRLACKCGRRGPWSRWRSDAVEAWNLKITELRKDE